MQQLQFHLTIHNPFRAVEGLIIDIKARCVLQVLQVVQVLVVTRSLTPPRAVLPEGASPATVENFRPEIDSFLDK